MKENSPWFGIFTLRPQQSPTANRLAREGALYQSGAPVRYYTGLEALDDLSEGRSCRSLIQMAWSSPICSL